MNMASPPAFLMAATVCWPFWLSISATTTLAPSLAKASAAALPSPMPAPVTTATLPWNHPAIAIPPVSVMCLFCQQLSYSVERGLSNKNTCLETRCNCRGEVICKYPDLLSFWRRPESTPPSPRPLDSSFRWNDIYVNEDRLPCLPARSFKILRNFQATSNGINVLTLSSSSSVSSRSSSSVAFRRENFPVKSTLVQNLANMSSRGMG